MDSDATCLSCNEGHKSDGDGGCVECDSGECCPPNTSSPTASHCITCSVDGNGCEKCSEGYVIDDVDGSCVECNEHECCPGNTHTPSAFNCHECSNDKTRCVSCIINTTLRVVSGGIVSCVSCGSDECCGSGNRGSIGEHCHSCTHDMSGCMSCDGGYKLEGGTCKVCGSDECCVLGNSGDVISNCHSCSSDNSSCCGCVFGNKLVGGSCMRCSVDECCPENTINPITSHCLVCDSDQRTCRTCKGGYLNLNGVCVDEGNSGSGGSGRGGGVGVGVIVGIVIVVVVVIVGIVSFMIIHFIIIPKHKNENKKNDDGDGNGRIEMNGVGGDVGCDGLEVMNEIGHGATSVVYRGRLRGKDVAVKIFNQAGGDDSGYVREIELMMRLKNPYIIEVYDKCVLSGHCGYVMEYVGLGSLDVVICSGGLSSGIRMRYGREICLGMRYLHSQNIIHRDLKLSNILVLSVNESTPESDVVCKISDFGTARETDINNTLSMSMSQSMTMTSNIGTPLYMAPEILSGQSHYSLKADVYSYGIVLCGVWNEQIPYSDESFENVTAFLTQVVNQGHRPSLKPDCPQPYVQLVSSCLQSDPHSRPSFSEISSSVYGVE